MSRFRLGNVIFVRSVKRHPWSFVSPSASNICLKKVRRFNNRDLSTNIPKPLVESPKAEIGEVKCSHLEEKSSRSRDDMETNPTSQKKWLNNLGVAWFKKEKWVKWFQNFLQVDQQNAIILIFNQIIRRGTCADFLKAYQIGTTFHSRFGSVCLHLWMVSTTFHRFEAPKWYKRELFHLVWKWMYHEMLHEGVSRGILEKVAVRQQRKGFGMLLALDESLKLEQEGKGSEVFAASLWRNVYLLEQPNRLMVLALHQYVSTNLQSLTSLGRDRLLNKGDFEWSPIPDAAHLPSAFEPVDRDVFSKPLFKNYSMFTFH